MSVTYGSIGWNRQKKLYDLAIVAGLAAYLALFILVGLYWHPFVTIETLLIRALGTCAFLLLHIVLVIGPLCRLYPRFLPLLYNRRHLGVTTFLVALAHGSLSMFQFHAAGDLNPLVSVLAGNTRYSSLSDFPFQTLGLAALVILFLMAATSHDFWLHNLTAPVWKIEYLRDTGASPPPFTEKVPTFDVRVVAGRVLVHPQPHRPGTRVEPAILAEARTA